LSLQGVHCGEDSGLGSIWEANLRVPAFARWPGRIAPGTETNALVSTLDIVPTILSITDTGVASTKNEKHVSLDGIDISSVLFGQQGSETTSQIDSINRRALFFWRDGFSDGPLPQPFGRFDVVAVKIGKIKAWYWTKSAHYNDDPEVYHDPPLLFDTVSDPGEAHPLNPQEHQELIDQLLQLTLEHKESINWTYPGPLALARDLKYIPCSNRENGCRTHDSTLQAK
jgi:arylsulfatase G